MSASAFGEPPPHCVERVGLFAFRLRSGPWLVAGVYPQGCDDQGRPGALAFHAVFVGRWAYRCAGGNPFAFASTLRSDWGSGDQDRVLPAIEVPVQWNRRSHARDPRSAMIATALTHGRQVVVRSTEPIEGLARSVWHLLPYRVRCRASLATWAFDNANQFDLVALPTPSGSGLDASEIVVSIDRGGR